MPVDTRLQAILDAGKALGGLPIEQQTVEQARADKTAMMARFVPMPEYAGVRVEERKVFVEQGAGGREIVVRIYSPPGKDGALPVVVFFHGGGWVVCTLETHDPICRALAMEAGVVVVSVDYRLAPEHKFPAAVEDCLAATEWVLAHAAELGRVDGSGVLVAGDSAGGTLATVVALLLRDKGVGGVKGQILLYPVTNYYDPPTASYLENAEGYGLTRKGMMWFWDLYLNRREEALDFRASPLLAPSLAGLPRAFVVAAEYDVLRDEALAYAKRMVEAGVDVTEVFVEGVNHAFMSSANVFPFLPQGKDVLRQIAAWVATG